LLLGAFDGGKSGSIQRHGVLIGGLNGHSAYSTREKSEKQLKNGLFQSFASLVIGALSLNGLPMGLRSLSCALF
jgi:hypothetical protein